MKKPVKQQQLVRETSTLIDFYDQYSPEDFESIAQTMRDHGILHIGLEPAGDSYNDCCAYEYRMETEKETDLRHAVELKKWEKQQEINAIKKEKDRGEGY
jgi:hypothetical protein